MERNEQVKRTVGRRNKKRKRNRKMKIILRDEEEAKV